MSSGITAEYVSRQIWAWMTARRSTSPITAGRTRPVTSAALRTPRARLQSRLEPVHLGLHLPRPPRADVRLQHQRDTVTVPADGLAGPPDDVHALVPLPLDGREHRVGA